MPRLTLTLESLAEYRSAGYLLIRGFLNTQESRLLRESAKTDQVLDKNSHTMDDGANHPVRLALWNHPGNSIYGMIARCQSLVTAMEQILGGEVYHYHSKMILKDAKVGGAWAWHQDYGYWYHNGVLAPLLASASIAVDAATRANGCLQVIRGSHMLGRIEHTLVGDQTGADLQRVKEIAKRLPTEYIEMAAGDALLFDCNLLHASAPNESEQSRWSMLCCYNAARNDPYKDSQHPRYTPLLKVADKDVFRAGHGLMNAPGDNAFWAKQDTSALPSDPN